MSMLYKAICINIKLLFFHYLHNYSLNFILEFCRIYYSSKHGGLKTMKIHCYKESFDYFVDSESYRKNEIEEENTK